MRRLLLSGVVAALVAVVACKKDQQPDPAPAPALSFKVNGQLLVDPHPIGEYWSDKRLWITGGDTVGNEVWTVFLQFDSVRAPSMPASGQLSYYYYNQSPTGTPSGAWTAYSSGPVQLAVTALDTATRRASGTFSGTLTAQGSTTSPRQQIITDGRFTDAILVR